MDLFPVADLVLGIAVAIACCVALRPVVCKTIRKPIVLIVVFVLAAALLVASVLLCVPSNERSEAAIAKTTLLLESAKLGRLILLAGTIAPKASPESASKISATTSIAKEPDGGRRAPAFVNIINLTADREGNLYIVDTSPGVIRKLTPNGTLSVLTPTSYFEVAADGKVNSRAAAPHGIAVDDDETVYFTDLGRNFIHKYSALNGLHMIAGGAYGITPEQGTLDDLRKQTADDKAKGKLKPDPFNRPQGIAVDPQGGVFVADTGNFRIRQIHLGGKVTTLAGINEKPVSGFRDGRGEYARFTEPNCIARDSLGNFYVTDEGAVRKITPEGIVTTLAGGTTRPDIATGTKDTILVHGYVDGPGKTALFGHLSSIAIDAKSNVFVLDQTNRAIRKIAPDGMVTSIVAGDRGPDTVIGTENDSFGEATAIALLPTGQLAIAIPTAVLVTEKHNF